MRAQVAGVVLMLLPVMACGGARAVVSTDPSPAGVSEARQYALATAIGLEVGIQQLDAFASSLEQVPAVPPSVRRSVDCAIVSVTGTARSTLALLEACGSVPPRAVAPLTQAVQAARTATSCASLGATLTALRPQIERLFDVLEAASENAAIRLGLSLLRMQFAHVTVTDGGASCR